MKVLLQNRADLFDKPGGDLVQMQKTQKALEMLGVEVKLSTELQPDLTGFDLVHVFNITRIHETFYQVKNAKRQGKKVVISPIHHKISEIERYERLGRTGKMAKINYVLPSISLREQAKAIVRLKDARQRPAIAAMLWQGFLNSQRFVLKETDGWIVLAESEAGQIMSDFGCQNKFFTAYNAVDPAFNSAVAPSNDQRFQGSILCVSRIEDRKNQLRLIEACRGLNKRVVFIGGVNKNHSQYVHEFMSLVEKEPDWLSYVGPVEYGQLPSIYAAAAVHVLPSWFEVVSLTALEASAVGCAGVVSDTGYIREYLQDSVAYCDPGDIESIRSSVQSLLQLGQKKKAVKIQDWLETGKQTLQAYEAVMAGKE